MKLYFANTTTTITTIMILILLLFIGYCVWNRSNINFWGRRSLVVIAYGLVVCCFALTGCEKNNQAENNELSQVEQNDENSNVKSEEEVSESSNKENTNNVYKVPEAYTKLLSQYSTALSEKWKVEKLMQNNLNYMLADCYGDAPFKNIGYAVKDLDGNGSAELIIGTTQNVSDDFYGKLIFDLYSLDNDGKASKIFSSGERNRYYYAGKNLFANVGSSGASDSVDTTVKLEKGKLIDLSTVTKSSDYKQLELSEISKNESTKSASVELAILDEINKNVTVGTAGSFMTAVQSAAKLLDWGTATDLSKKEIKDGTIAWLSDKGNDEQVAFSEKMKLVDDAYKKLLGEDAKELLTSAGCEDVSCPWSDATTEKVEVIMEAIGLR